MRCFSYRISPDLAFVCECVYKFNLNTDRIINCYTRCKTTNDSASENYIKLFNHFLDFTVFY